MKVTDETVAKEKSYGRKQKKITQHRKDMQESISKTPTEKNTKNS